MAKQLLIENMPFTVALVEDKDKPGRYFARGEYARHDRPTENKRFYKTALWEREIKRLNEAMQDRRVMGELDHPADGRTKLQRVSHLLTGLTVKGDGQVYGESEIMDTPNGRILKAILAAGGKVGVSSRGFGSTKANAQGIEEVQDDFQLQTFDFVADPATKTAYPAIFQEELVKIPEDGMELTLEDLKRDYPGLVTALSEEAKAATTGKELQEAVLLAEERTEKRLTEKFSTELRRQLEQVESVAKEKALSEALSDPEVAGAKQILERIHSMVASFGVPADMAATLAAKDEEIARLRGQVAEKELEVQKVQKQTEEMALIAKEATYRLHLERFLSTNESKEAIIALVGDVTRFKSIKEMEGQVGAVVEELSKTAQAKEQDAQSAQEAIEVKERLTALEAKVADEERARKAAEDALKVAQEEKERAEDRAKKALALAEEMEQNLSAQVEEAKTETSGQHPALDEDQAARIRARIARGRERSIVEDTTGKPDGANGKKDGKGNGASENPLSEFGLTEDVFNEFAGVRTGK